MTTMVYAYSGMHEALPYEHARNLAISCTEEDVEGRKIFLARVSEEGFEMVGFFVDREGFEFQEDSTYITYEDGMRLAAEGLVDLLTDDE